MCFTIFCALLFAGCRTENPSPEITSGTREIVDDLGKTVKLPQKIERAVSLAPNLTENIFAVGAGDRLVGVTTFCNYPEAAQSIQKVGDTDNEKIRPTS